MVRSNYKIKSIEDIEAFKPYTNPLTLIEKKPISIMKLRNDSKPLLFYLFILLFIGCRHDNDATVNQLSGEKQNGITDYLRSQSKNTLGLAAAVIKDGEVIYENYFGKENLAGKAVNKETVFPLYSVSKLITSTAIFQLVEQDKIRLNDKISKYIENLPTKWKNIEVMNLLTHSSGLPDYDIMKGELSDSTTMKNLIKNKLRFETGERWEYNQTNFWFLAKIIEKASTNSYENFVAEHQFPNRDILFSSNFIEPIPNRSHKYTFNTTSQNWDKLNFDFGKRTNSAGGINLTLNQLVEWTINFDNNKFIKPSTKDMMWTPFEYNTPFYFENETDKFLYGWQQYSSNNEISYGFTGGMVTGYRKFINQNMTIIILTNGLKNYPIRNKVINKIASIVDEHLTEKF